MAAIAAAHSSQQGGAARAMTPSLRYMAQSQRRGLLLAKRVKQTLTFSLLFLRFLASALTPIQPTAAFTLLSNPTHRCHLAESLLTLVHLSPPSLPFHAAIHQSKLLKQSQTARCLNGKRSNFPAHPI